MSISDILNTVQNGVVAANNITELLTRATASSCGVPSLQVKFPAGVPSTAVFPAGIPSSALTGTIPSSLIPTSTAATRPILTAARTYYVSSGGSSANSGLASSTPFATIQQAVDAACAIDMGPYQVTIQVSSGTYSAGASLLPYVGTLMPIIVGSSTPANTVVNSSDSCFLSASGASWRVQSVTLATTVAYGLNALFAGSQIFFSSVNFSSCLFGHITANRLAMVRAEGNYSISAGGNSHVSAIFGGVADINGVTATLSSTPTFGAFAIAQINGLVQAATWASAGTGAIGQRYTGQINATIYTGGGSSNFFPGNAAGSVDATSVYG